MLGWPQFLAGVGQRAMEAGAGQPHPWPLGVAAQVADKGLFPLQHVDGPHSAQTGLVVAVAAPDTERLLVKQHSLNTHGWLIDCFKSS